ncbi:uncharacterized protein BJ171DRAFT_495460 [Polychytrium aggregatum]|uniref:uncharacterized protein n=1 Tax=Polychytrium aggregatum TaxID=110093 RepID=UPI0022FF1576|nr:uncharacterized protein BJ171DRAFT_495460 [Polychytrium aggregatum]KAI9207025.1 hypothetical protein BJ171DRAFT_495460 [Polychytrium aggregatum]
MSTQPRPDSHHPPAGEIASLKNVVENVLLKRGVLGNLKAQLRAAVFLVLQEETAGSSKKLPLEASTKLDLLRSSPDARLALDLIMDFLECFNLEYTLAVMTSEAGLPERTPGHHRRPNVSQELKLESSTDDTPLLLQLIEHRHGDLKALQHLRSQSTSIQPLTDDKSNKFVILSEPTSLVSSLGVPAKTAPLHRDAPTGINVSPGEQSALGHARASSDKVQQDRSAQSGTAPMHPPPVLAPTALAPISSTYPPNTSDTPDNLAEQLRLADPAGIQIDIEDEVEEDVETIEKDDQTEDHTISPSYSTDAFQYDEPAELDSS